MNKPSTQSTGLDLRPTHQFGYINPVVVSDFIHYQFYLVAPPRTHWVAYHINLQAFTKQGVDEALTAFWAAVDFLIKRKVERIILGGIPLSAYAGRPRILELLAEARKRTDIPVTTDFEEAILALRHLGVQRVVTAAKWDEPQMDAVVAYLRHAGLEVLGAVGEAHNVQQVAALRPDESIDVALQLGRTAFQRHPDADGLLLAGGAWLVLQAVPQLEAEFGKPVVTNPGSSYWAALRQAGLQSQTRGLGRLLDSLDGKPVP
jgi:maleate cis-trans isomerase